MDKKQKNLRGSILVFTLLVLTILLSAALTSAGVVITGKNSSRATEKSALAFQIADGAAENVLKRVYKDTDSTLSQLAGNLHSSSQPPQCQTGGVITGSLPGGSGVYSVAFFDNSGASLNCSGTGYSTYNEWRTKLVRIVASGSYAGATRAIDVTIKPPICTDATVDYGGDTYDTIAIGNQCWLQQNLNVGSRINGSTPQTDNSTDEKYCYSDSNGNCTSVHPTEPDGGLYTWDEAMQYVTTEGTQGICPSGWHIPTDDDWYELENFVDPSIITPTEPGYPGNLADTGWRGTDAGTQLKPAGASGFEGNLAGYRDSIFQSRGTEGRFWTSTDDGPSPWARYLETSLVARVATVKSMAFSIRCIKD